MLVVPTSMLTATVHEDTMSSADQAALAAVIARFHARMVAAAARVLNDHDEAEDAVQDAYLQAVRHLDQFDRRARLSTWLHRVVTNAALMRLRARRRRPTEDMDTMLLADDTADVEAIVERRQTQALVRRSLADVPITHRTVLVLSHLEDGHPADVARRLGLTRLALKLRAHRARKVLRAHLVRSGIAGVHPPRSSRGSAGRPGQRGASNRHPTTGIHAPQIA
jgi:RNA polymerase sigma-70 factor (ECF subfamily)